MRTDSLTVKLQQEISAGAEVFVDALYLSDRSVTKGEIFNADEFIFGANMLGDPFNQAIFVTFPAPGKYGDYLSNLTTERITAGAIVHRFDAWTAEFDFTAGQSLERQQQPSVA